MMNSTPGRIAIFMLAIVILGWFVFAAVFILRDVSEPVLSVGAQLRPGATKALYGQDAYEIPSAIGGTSAIALKRSHLTRCSADTPS